MKSILCLAALAALVACVSPPKNNGVGGSVRGTPPASAQTDLSDFVGARGGQAEGGLQARGYTLSRTEGLTAYWYNATANDCARIVTSDGRYSSVEKVSAAQCTGGGGATAAGTPTAAEQICLREVTATTNNPDVALIRSSFSEAGTEVIVGVGPQRAPWRCIAYANGTTAGIMSMTNEGSL